MKYVIGRGGLCNTYGTWWASIFSRSEPGIYYRMLTQQLRRLDTRRVQVGRETLTHEIVLTQHGVIIDFQELVAEHNTWLPTAAAK